MVMEIKRRSNADIALDDLYIIHNDVMHCAEIRNGMECLKGDLKRRYTGCDELIAELEAAQEKIKEVHHYLTVQQHKQRDSVRSYMKN